jgi:uncharacterized surface protein with fasciclin (FAS1) repeats
MNKNIITIITAVSTMAFSTAFANHHSGYGENKEKSNTGNIVETAVAAGSFETLVAAAQAAGLVEALSGEGPFTVFAPTDEAFAALPEGTVAALLLEENRDQLIAILTYHVVPGKVKAADVAGLDSATTLQGQDITITVEDETVRIDGATVVKTDVRASNGVIHVIDAVILPSAD